MKYEWDPDTGIIADAKGAPRNLYFTSLTLNITHVMQLPIHNTYVTKLCKMCIHPLVLLLVSSRRLDFPGSRQFCVSRFSRRKI